MKRIRYDPAASLVPGTGLDEHRLADFAPQLEAARREVLDDVELWRRGGAVPDEKKPLDAGFVDLPEKMLDAFRRDGAQSELGRIRTVADRLAGEVDRVVVLGIGGSYMGSRALMEACCHPYHNELSRQKRGGRPRLYFEGNSVDNDFWQGLLDLLPKAHEARGPEQRWAIVVESKSGSTLETAVALRRFLAALETSLGGEQSRLAELVVPVTGTDGRLHQLAGSLECRDVFAFPDGVGGRYSVLTAIGLLPAAILGLDVVGLLEGAADMNERFRTAQLGENPVLDYTGVAHLMEAQRGATIRVLAAWSKGLEAVGLWYDQLLAESLGKEGQGATPLSTVNTRDLHSRHQQHQQGREDKLITNLLIDDVCREPLSVGRRARDEDGLNELAETTVPQIMAAAFEGTNQALADDHRPTADLHLPRLDEPSLGQLLQMLMLATVMEGRLKGINPYGQPGVEAYKRYMNARLRGT